jgi:hypothetical protein
MMEIPKIILQFYVLHPVAWESPTPTPQRKAAPPPQPKHTAHWKLLWILSDCILIFWQKAVLCNPVVTSGNNFANNYTGPPLPNREGLPDYRVPEASRPATYIVII